MRSALSRSSQLRPVHGLLVGATLILVFALFTLAAIGPLEGLDVALNRPRHLAPWRDELRATDRIGQRAVGLPLLGIVVAIVALRARRLRPVTVAVLGVLSLNLVTLILKFTLGRGSPRLGDPDFFSGGEIYPSGHTGNVVVVYGLIVYVLIRYGAMRMRWRPWLVVAVLSAVMVGTSLALRWHWFTDLIGGLLIGAAVLVLTCTVDAMIPVHTDGGRPGPRPGPLDSKPARSARVTSPR